MFVPGRYKILEATWPALPNLTAWEGALTKSQKSLETRYEPFKITPLAFTPAYQVVPVPAGSQISRYWESLHNCSTPSSTVHCDIRTDNPRARSGVGQRVTCLYPILRSTIPNYQNIWLGCVGYTLTLWHGLHRLNYLLLQLLCVLTMDCGPPNQTPIFLCSWWVLHYAYLLPSTADRQRTEFCELRTPL